VENSIKYLAPWLVAAGVAGALALAPLANADTDPCTPYGTEPMSPCVWGYHPANTPQIDVPF
jgi:hypothetical protein